MLGVGGTVAPVLHGRDRERALLTALIDDARGGRAGAIVVHGEPGVGKSSLLREVLAQASEIRVLRTQGMESESPLAFAALQRLLRPVVGVLDRLPMPQARALRVAFGLDEGDQVEPFLVAVATLSILTEAAEERPVVCVVDDAHWLDEASADALLFAVRRLEADRVAVLFAARDGDSRVFAPEGISSITLPGLDDAAVRALLSEVAHGGVAPEVVDRLRAETGGNPLALTELPTALTRDQLEGTAPLPAHLMLTGGVGKVFLARCKRLPARAQTLMLVAVTDDTGNLAVVQRAAAALGAGQDAMEAAERSGLITVTGDRIEMRHPLVRSAIYPSAGVAARERAHLALADALGWAGDADRQTWHRAAVAGSRDDALVDALDEVGARAERRGGYLAAADAYERSALLSVSDPHTARRLFDAARNAWACGHTVRASELVTRARERADDPLLLADIDRLRGRIQVNVGSAPDAHRIFTQAAQAVAAHDQVRALEMAVAAAVAQGHGVSSGAVLDPAVIHVDPSPLDTPRSACLKQLLISTRSSLAGDLRLAIGQLHLAQETGRTLTDLDVLGNLGNAALHVGDDESHHAFYTLMLSTAREAGDAMSVLYALQRLAFSQLLSGKWVELRSSSEEAVALSLSIGQRALSAAPHAWLVLLSALKGREDYDDRLAQVEALVESHPPPGILAHPIQHSIRWAKAVHAAMGAEPAVAEHHFAHMELPTLTMMVAQDRVDAAVRAGDLVQSRTWVRDVEDFAARTDWPWAHAAAAFGQARIAEVDDSAGTDEIVAAFEAALTHHARAERPYDRARTQLAYGEFLRRTQRRVDARSQLRAALSTFEDLDAEPLVARATQELRATGETARKRDPSTLVKLTPMELKVAELVSQGLSNKDVAAQIWVSPRTVAFHLRNVFAKVNVTSRGQLSQLNLS